MQKIPLIIIVGPTAVGKTELALSVAVELGAEIISADSMQVYRGMDIGTAKASKEEQQKIKHHLIDIVDPDEVFNVADYIILAEEAIASINSRRKVPLLTGGTGLYVNALIDGFLFPDTTADPQLRKELYEKAEHNPAELYTELSRVDPITAERLHPNDHRRIIRALEVYYRTGEAMSSLQKKAAQAERPYIPHFFGLTRERSELYKRIDQRVDLMIENGLVSEVKLLLEHYNLPEDDGKTALQALGYKEIVRALQGECSLEEAVATIKRDTRRYAKRQLSWFRRDKRIRWFDLSYEHTDAIQKQIITAWNS